MATKLIVRNVDEDVTLALKQRAAAHGCSVEAERREILKDALQRPQRRSFAEVLGSMPEVGKDADFDRHKGVTSAMWLVDANVTSEARKAAKANAGVIDFLRTHRATDLYVCGQTIGEIRRGVEKFRQRGDLD